MEQHFILTDATFKKQFETCTLDPELFTHEAHLRLAWIHITTYGLPIALENVSKQLKDFVASVEAEQKYNHTLTIAAVKAVAHFINKSTAHTFKDFIMEFPQLNHRFKDLMACHYRVDIFNSETAKTTFLEPDLLPFD